MLGDALKYCARGGVLVGIRRRGERALVEVWDTGIGIESRHLEQVFYQVGNEERSGDKGVGLGLAIVRRQGLLIGAEVGCRSWPGKGSVFFISLPLAADPPGPVPEKR